MGRFGGLTVAVLCWFATFTLFSPFVAIVNGAERGCFEQKGSEYVYDGGACLDSKLIPIEVDTEAFSIDFQFKDNLVGSQHWYKISVAGCDFIGVIADNVPVAGKEKQPTIGVPGLIFGLPATITVNKTGGFAIKDKDFEAILTACSLAPVFEKEASGKFSSKISFELTDGNKFPGFTAIVKDPTKVPIDDGSDKKEPFNYALIWGPAIGVVVVLILVGIGVGIFCFCRRRKARQQQDAHEVEKGDDKSKKAGATKSTAASVITSPATIQATPKKGDAKEKTTGGEDGKSGMQTTTQGEDKSVIPKTDKKNAEAPKEAAVPEKPPKEGHMSIFEASQLPVPEKPKPSKPEDDDGLASGVNPFFVPETFRKYTLPYVRINVLLRPLSPAEFERFKNNLVEERKKLQTLEDKKKAGGNVDTDLTNQQKLVANMEYAVEVTNEENAKKNT